MKYFCLSFDLEEFDIPLEFNTYINKEDMLNISLEGTKNILSLIEKYKIKSTFFVTTDFYRRYPDLIKNISKIHEIASHGEHNKDYNKMKDNEIIESIKQNKLLLENGIKRKITGFRAPRMLILKHSILRKANIKYDASLHPTYVPGRYNHLFRSRKISRKEGVMVIPTSVSPFTRTPMTWLWFRNLGLKYAKICTNLCFLTDSYVNIYFHPWEFVSLTNWKIPTIIKRNTGKIIYNKLDKYISWLIRKRVNFITLNELAEKNLI